MTLVEQLHAAGWVASPNNIHALPGVLMYASSTGMMALPPSREAQVLHDRIRVFETRFFGEHYSRRSYVDTVTVAVFDNAAEFLRWVQETGVVATANPPYSAGEG